MVNTRLFYLAGCLLCVITLINFPLTAQAKQKDDPQEQEDVSTSLVEKNLPRTTFLPNQLDDNPPPATSLTPLQQLQQMQQMQTKKNFGMFFVSITATNVESLRYYHAFWQEKNYAQLTTMDGIAQDIIQKDQTISYFSPTAPAFSLKSSHITDKFPSILSANLKEISKHYHIMPMGLYRIANRLVHRLRIVSKDHFRHQILLFLDSKNHLLLRQDIMDRDNNLLEQFSVVNIIPTFNVPQFIENLTRLDTPPLLEMPTPTNETFTWQAKWLPQGFRKIKSSIQKQEDGSLTQTQFYSDGLFSFSLTLSPSIIKDAPEKSWTQGALTLYTQTRGEQDLTLIGQLPIATAKRIVDDTEIQ